jgi:hypothetical protein
MALGHIFYPTPKAHSSEKNKERHLQIASKFSNWELKFMAVLSNSTESLEIWGIFRQW